MRPAVWTRSGTDLRRHSARRTSCWKARLQHFRTFSDEKAGFPAERWRAGPSVFRSKKRETQQKIENKGKTTKMRLVRPEQNNPQSGGGQTRGTTEPPTFPRRVGKNACREKNDEAKRPPQPSLEKSSRGRVAECRDTLKEALAYSNHTGHPAARLPPRAPQTPSAAILST